VYLPVFSSIVSKTELVGVNSALEIIVKAKLQIINSVATIAVALGHKTTRRS
jgi:hypothetical protein